MRAAAAWEHGVRAAAAWEHGVQAAAAWEHGVQAAAAQALEGESEPEAVQVPAVLPAEQRPYLPDTP